MPEREVVLGIETANGRSSLCLSAGGALLAEAQCERRDALGWLRGSVPQLLAQAGVAGSELAALAVSHGPGALTGVRVGVAYAQGLALAWRRPLVGINTLHALAWSAWQAAGDVAVPLSVALDARMGEIYEWHGAALPPANDEPGDRLAAPQPPAGIALYAGPGWEAYAEQLPAQSTLLPGLLPQAQAVSVLGAQAHAAGLSAPPADLAIRYLREQVAQVPRRVSAGGRASPGG